LKFSSEYKGCTAAERGDPNQEQPFKNVNKLVVWQKVTLKNQDAFRKADIHAAHTSHKQSLHLYYINNFYPVQFTFNRKQYTSFKVIEMLDAANRIGKQNHRTMDQ